LGCWKRLPNKALFLCLLLAWLTLFQFLGNSTLGYVRTPSLFLYLYDAFSGGGKGLLDSEEGYGMFMPLVVLALFWVKRRELMAIEFKPWWPAMLLVGLGLVLHVLGYLVQQPRISVVGLFTGIFGMMGLAWGLAWMRAGFFPFFLLGFCVPLGSLAVPITFRLRLLVCWLVEALSQNLLAIDILREGTILKDPSGRYQYEVAAACSGIRSQIATLALAVVLAFFSLRSWPKRLIMIASAFPLAVLGNLLRMMAIVIAGEIGGQDWGNYVHDGGPGGVFSLLPYLPAFAGLLYLEHLLRDDSPQASASNPVAKPA